MAKIISILAMIANALAENICNCLVAGIDAHITKSLDVKKVLLNKR